MFTTEQLGEAPKPVDEKWMANLVFKTRSLKPRVIRQREPAYKPALNADSIARLQAARPKGAKRYERSGRLKVKFTLKVAERANAIRRMDLDADVPDLSVATRAPAKLSLEKAWFYKDDPVVRDAVELGQIMRRAFPFKTPAQFRALAKGESADAFRKFIGGVTLKEVPRR